jgi:hypothetical protein
MHDSDAPDCFWKGEEGDPSLFAKEGLVSLTSVKRGVHKSPTTDCRRHRCEGCGARRLLLSPSRAACSCARPFVEVNGDTLAALLSKAGASASPMRLVHPPPEVV